MTSSGRLFQTLAAATSNDRSPTVDRRRRGTTRDREDVTIVAEIGKQDRRFGVGRGTGRVGLCRVDTGRSGRPV